MEILQGECLPEVYCGKDIFARFSGTKYFNIFYMKKIIPLTEKDTGKLGAKGHIHFCGEIDFRNMIYRSTASSSCSLREQRL